MTTMTAAELRSELAKRMTEKALQAQVVAFAKHHNWSIYHTHDSRRSQPGFPDLVLVRERVVWAELKTEKGKLTEAQESWLGLLKEAGCEAYCWRPSQWEEIAGVLSCDAGALTGVVTSVDECREVVGR